MGAVDALEFVVIQGLTVAVMLVWAAAIVDQPETKIVLAAAGWAVLAFAALAIGRYLTADIEYVARLEIIQVLMYAFLFFAIVTILYRQGIGAYHQLHADFSGNGDFVLCRLSIF